VFENRTTLLIPNGFVVDYMPESKTFKDELLQCEITYKIVGNSIIYHQTVTQDYLVLNLAQQKLVNETIKKIEKYYKEIIVLKKK
jgi:hypothetical protein